MALLHKLLPIMASFVNLPNYQERRSSANVIQIKVKRLYRKAEAIEHCFEWQLGGAKCCQDSVFSATFLLPSLWLVREFFCHID
jgi:hypothetical protein